ncbi:MAG: DNA translocase FtsK, partial [Patescibacteria group bacterium]
MANGKQKKSAKKESWEKITTHRLHPETKRSIWAVILLGAAAVLLLAYWGKAGPAGAFIYKSMSALLGVGYAILPIALMLGAAALIAGGKRLVSTTLFGITLLVFSILALIEVASPGHGGALGLALGSLRIPFGTIAASVINGIIAIISILMTFNFPIKLKYRPLKKEKIIATGTNASEHSIPENDGDENETTEESESKKTGEGKENAIDGEKIQIDEEKIAKDVAVYENKQPAHKIQKSPFKKFANYTPPPISILKSAGEKPTTGDLLANANIIKRTLDSFGIPVEMGEINIGPAVTRYTLKPAEGVKLSRITALNQDLAMALAAHPIRIEAPIPGKSLVGVEVPNKAAALVRLGSLMNYPDFQKSGPLGFVLGRDVSGEPIFVDIERMPHLLVAGATGSGKSILIHALLISLLYKNSPATLKLVLIDPKRVELSIYARIPHLVSPVVTESKKAVGVFRWAIGEMERRYELLLQAGSRDIK